MERILLKGGRFRKKKFKTYLKRKKLKMMTINYNFAIKLLVPIFIILLVIFINLKMRIPIKKKLSNQILKISNNNTSYFACFCAMAREENKYANELISYYSKLGIEKFIFADNNLNGTEKLADVLQIYIDKGIVDIYSSF